MDKQTDRHHWWLYVDKARLTGAQLWTCFRVICLFIGNTCEGISEVHFLFQFPVLSYPIYNQITCDPVHAETFRG
jgi:hypothetical protein